MQLSKSISIEARSHSPKKRMFFNTFSVSRERVPGFTTMEFAFIDRSEPTDTFFCIAAHHDLAAWKRNFLEFAATIDISGTEHGTPPFPPYMRHREVEVSDFIGMAQHGVFGEIIIHSFSWKVAVDLSAEKASTQKPAADMVALLRCPSCLLKEFVFSLYATDDDETQS